MARRKVSKTLARLDALTLRRALNGTLRTTKKRLHDGGGLYLRVSPSGGSWVYRYQTNGRVRAMGLGSLAHAGAPEARELARQLRTGKATGGDPLAERRTRRRREAARTSFKAAAERVLAITDASTMHPKTWRVWRHTVEAYMFPDLADVPLDDIDHARVLAVLQPLWTTKLDIGRRVRSRLEHILDDARLRGMMTAPNPARWPDLKAALSKFVPAQLPKHHRAMDWRRVPAFVAWLEGKAGMAALALRFGILSGTRTGETLNARFAEFDDGIWTIPAERMKARRQHKVPMSTGMASLVAELERARRGPLLFPGDRADEPLSDAAMINLLRGNKIAATVHGFRKFLP